MVTGKFGGNVQCKFQTLDGLCLCKEACKETHMEKKRGVKHLGWKLGVQWTHLSFVELIKVSLLPQQFS